MKRVQEHFTALAGRPRLLGGTEAVVFGVLEVVQHRQDETRDGQGRQCVGDVHHQPLTVFLPLLQLQLLRLAVLALSALNDLHPSSWEIP